MAIYGYCRISTSKQNIERQVRNILSVHPDAIIIREIFTGTKFQDRKELDKILRMVTAKDTITFDSVSRMSRNEEEGCSEYERLFKRGITLEFLKEPHINTEVYKQTLSHQINFSSITTGHDATDKFMNTVVNALNNYMMNLSKEQIRIAFRQAQKEVDDLHQRTKEGIITAKLNGKQIGQKRGCKLNIKKKVPIQKEMLEKSFSFGGTYSDKDLIKVLGISRNTYYKYKKELYNQQNI